MSNLSWAKVVRGCWIVNAVDGLADNLSWSYASFLSAVRARTAI
jgi:hypothetical protein